jgi:lambda repressor-like predicted transcriptional regulator
MTESVTLKDRIRQRLEHLGLSPRAASLKAELSTHYLQRVLAESGPSITTENLLKLAAALEVSPEWLLTGRHPADIPASASEMLEIYLAMDEADRKTLMDFARWTLNNQR